MKIIVRKDVYEELMKSYIARWGYPGHYRYKYYEPDTGANGGGSADTSNSKKNSSLYDATNNIASTTTTMEGIPTIPNKTSNQKAKKYVTLNARISQVALNRLNKIKTEKIEPSEFLNKLKSSFEADIGINSNYITKKTRTKELVLRLSNHSANGEYVGKNQKEVSIVINLSVNNFKNPDKKDIIEYVYDPKNLTKEVKDGIVQGLINWIKNGVYSDTHADSINKSIIDL